MFVADIQTGGLHIKTSINTAWVTSPSATIITTTIIIIVDDDYED